MFLVACTDAGPPASQRYTFSWPFETQDGLAPRGGKTRGAPVEVLEAPSADLHVLQAHCLTDFERDRRSILSMAGP
jgi:hypothetical protein